MLELWPRFRRLSQRHMIRPGLEGLRVVLVLLAAESPLRGVSPLLPHRVHHGRKLLQARAYTSEAQALVEALVGWVEELWAEILSRVRDRRRGRRRRR